MDTPKGGLFYTLRVSNILPGKATPRLSVMSNVVVHPKTIVDHASGGASKPKLLDEVRAHIRRLNYSIRTEDAYVDWVGRIGDRPRFPGFCSALAENRNGKPWSVPNSTGVGVTFAGCCRAKKAEDFRQMSQSGDSA